MRLIKCITVFALLLCTFSVAHGVDIGEGLSLSSIFIFQSTSGVTNSISSSEDRTDATLSLDINMQKGFGTGVIYMLLNTSKGKGINQINTFSGMNADAWGDTALSLKELWYEHKGGLLKLRAGQVDLTTEFDTNSIANNEDTQFLSNMFVNNAALEFPASTGAGVSLWVTHKDYFKAGLGFADADDGFDEIFDSGFYIAEADISLADGNYRAYYWYNHKDHISNDNMKSDKRNSGYGISLDQRLGDSVYAFARYGAQNEEVSEFGSSLSAGIRHSMASLGRDKDSLGIAYGTLNTSGDYKENSPVSSKNELHAEAFYDISLNDALSLTPDVQYVKNSLGNEESGDFWVYGIRGHIVF